jgi:hypothetical protein
MVAKDEEDITEKTMYEAHYKTWKKNYYKNEKKHRTWYRLFFPNDADWTVNRNPYAQTHRHNVYNIDNNYYPRLGSNHFRDHLNE